MKHSITTHETINFDSMITYETVFSVRTEKNTFADRTEKNVWPPAGLGRVGRAPENNRPEAICFFPSDLEVFQRKMHCSHAQTAIGRKKTLADGKKRLASGRPDTCCPASRK